MKILPARSPDVPCGRTDKQTDWQTDRHDGTNSRFFVTFAKGAYKQKNLVYNISN